MKINTKRLVIALIVGTVVINIISPVQEMFDYWFNAFKGLPDEVIVTKSFGSWLLQIIIFLVVFQVIIPMLVYVFLAEIAIKKSNIFIGVIFGVCCFLVGSLPQLMTFPLLVNVSNNFVLIRAAWSVITLVLIGGVIGGIYKPVILTKEKSRIEEEESAI